MFKNYKRKSGFRNVTVQKPEEPIKTGWDSDKCIEPDVRKILYKDALKTVGDEVNDFDPE